MPFNFNKLLININKSFININKGSICPLWPSIQLRIIINCMQFVVHGLIPLMLPFVFHKGIDVFLKIAERNGNICDSFQ